MFATMGASVGSEGLLTQIYKKIAYREGDPPATVLLMGWGNLPSRADMSLYDLTTFCQENEALGSLFGGYIFDINNLLPYLGGSIIMSIGFLVSLFALPGSAEEPVIGVR